MSQSESLTGQQCRWARRNELGVSQQQLAKDAGVSRTYITNFESGVYEPSDKVKQKLRAHFEKNGVDFSEVDSAANDEDQPPTKSTGRTNAKRPGWFKGPECIYISAKISDDQERERIIERVFAIRERLAEIGSEKVVTAFFNPYNDKTIEFIDESRAMLTELGLLYERLFGSEFAAVPTKALLDGKSAPATITDALGLLFKDVFSRLNIRRNAKQTTAAEPPAESTEEVEG